jgi:RecJ-like exonuclease
METGVFLEITGICNVCGRSGKMYTCSMCGTIVCADCYDHELGLCRSCKNILKGKKTLKDKKRKEILKDSKRNSKG